MMHREHLSMIEAVGLPFDGGSTVGICSSCGVAAPLRFTECADCRAVGFSYDEECVRCDTEGVVNGEGLCSRCEAGEPLSTSCGVCGELNVPIDEEGQAPDHCDSCSPQFDCPVCETYDYQWNGDGCSCWWCPCQVTNPAHLTICECGRAKG